MNVKKTNPLLLSAKMLLLGFTFSAAMISCSDDDDDDNDNAPKKTVLDIAVENDNFDVLAAAATKAGLTGTLDGNTKITVFAPTDAAFVSYLGVANEAAAITAVNGLTQAAAADLLSYHVISGSEIKSEDITTGPVTTARAGANNKAFVTKTGSAVTINNARVTSADVEASNGVIHIIDAVLTPPSGNIISVATTGANASQFNILATALAKANLVTTLQGNGPYTVFAPTDEAFLAFLRTALGNQDLNEAGAISAINDLTASSSPVSLTTLTEVLKYHVVSASAYSVNLANGQLTTLKDSAPKTVTVAGAGSAGVTITGSATGATASNVTSANISASNGVIHVIDRVLLP